MRGGRKDEEKSLSPMFPRLHVNDTEKGGPRAPPRNKMALYEQLSIPTQKFSSGSAQPNTSSLPSSSSGQMAGHKRSIFSSFSKLSAQSHQVEKLHCHRGGGAMQNNMGANNEQKLVKAKVLSGSLSSSPQYNSFVKKKFSTMPKDVSMKNVREKPEFSVSATEQPKHDVQNHDRERMSSSMTAKRRLAIEPQINVAVLDCESRRCEETRAEESQKLAKGIQNQEEKPFCIPSIRDGDSAEANTSCSTKFKDSEKAMKPLRTPARENPNSLSNSNRLFGGRTFQEGLAEQNIEAFKDKVGCTKVLCLENSSSVIRESSSELSPRDGDEKFDNPDSSIRPNEYKQCDTVDLRDVDSQDNISGSSMEEPTTAPNISPDVVVGVIGEKQFWKARKAIVNQQRIFAVQVFELHRLIKVQRLIAESPHILVEEYLDKPPSTVAAVKNKLSEYSQPPPPNSTPKDSCQQQNLDSECADKNPPCKLPSPSPNKDNSKPLITQKSSYELHLKSMPQAPAATKSEPWCLNPMPGNQWLVPVMSPSEGLIYKSYTGPFPPSAGYMSLSSGIGDYFTAGYTVPASQQQGFGFFPGTIPLNQAYFPPYGLPVPNQSVSESATDQMSQSSRVKPTKQENQSSSMVDVDYLTRLHSSFDMPSQMSHVIPFHAQKFHRSNGSELQGSTASSPSERRNGDVLPLFPTEPEAEESCPNAESSEHKSRAIKAVPHNPRSATESAARIFQLIQEERRQL